MQCFYKHVQFPYPTSGKMQKMRFSIFLLIELFGLIKMNLYLMCILLSDGLEMK